MWLGRLEPASAVAWVVFTVLATAGAWYLLRGPLRSPFRLAVKWIGLAVPVAAVIASLAAFAGGGHPLVQYNADHGGWSLWFHCWPLLMLGALLCCVISLGMIFARQGDRAQGGWGLLLVSNGVTLFAVGSNWPSA